MEGSALCSRWHPIPRKSTIPFHDRPMAGMAECGGLVPTVVVPGRCNAERQRDSDPPPIDRKHIPRHPPPPAALGVEPGDEGGGPWPRNPTE